MGKRREGREAAVQFLYQSDMQATTVGDLLPHFWNLRVGPSGKCAVPLSSRQYAETLIRGIVQHREDIDKRITALVQNYSLERIAGVDRNVLRLGIYELIHSHEVPPVVIINECIEIAKKFGSEDSGRFVNGVLDRLRMELPRPAREAAPQPS